ncbi:hypothetical protein Q9189_004205 [Teloschistes chrysophthalmus]
MSDSSAQVLFLRLEDYEQPEFFDDLYRGICSQISAKYTTMVVKDAPDVQGLLSSPSLKVILIVDSTLSQGKFTALQKQLARFVKAGGVLVVCCFFSNSVCPPNAHKMWKNFDLPWTYGDYHRTTFYLSQKAKVFFGNQRAGTLERQCSMKTLHLKGSTVDSRVYVPLEQSRTQSMVFARDTVDQNLSPAAWAKSGNGSLGYIGDVNNEAGTHKLLMVMLVTFFIGWLMGLSFKQARWTDLTITCRGQKFKCHKAVVCSQVKFFDAACSNGFKTYRKTTLKLIKFMLHFLYGRPEGSTPADPEDPLSAYDDLKESVGLLKLADKYDIPALKVPARLLTQEEFHEITVQMMDLMHSIPGFREEVCMGLLRKCIFAAEDAEGQDWHFTESARWLQPRLGMDEEEAMKQ